MRADLHIHTRYSDGLHTPSEVAHMAREAGMDLVSFTDHDTLLDVGEKRAAAAECGLKYVVGWEISSYDADRKIHVLGYGCEEGTAYAAFEEERRRGAIVRAEDMIAKANAFFSLHVTLFDVEAEHFEKDAPLHTMHVVRAFAKRIGMDEGEAYLSFFRSGKVAYSSLCRATPEEAIDVIHASRGIAVLAHPGRIELPPTEKKTLFDRLTAAGLDGIECRYTTHTVSETEAFQNYARGHGLLMTGGSDFHASDGKHRIGFPRFEPDERLLEALRIS